MTGFPLNTLVNTGVAWNSWLKSLAKGLWQANTISLDASLGRYWSTNTTKTIGTQYERGL